MIGAALLTPTWSSSGASDGPADPDKPTSQARTARVAPSVSGAANQRITRSFDGHYYVTARVNGVPIRFMIDTGASIVALSTEDAERARVPMGDQISIARGVGGEVEVTPVTIDSIAVDGLTARSVRGAVADGLHVSLLGQSFLSQLNGVEISGDTMTLR
ncbi:MAG: TIGR02281 family clan AA aspartic protease [Sphingomonas sp.]